MGVVRNFIDIEGISSSDDLCKNTNGQVIQSSESEHLVLNNINSDIKNIFQILVKSEINSTKTIKTPINKLVMLDGVKKFKIIYYDKFDKAGIIELERPYNTFIEMDNKSQEIKDIKIYILDAYFQLLENNILYSNLLYYIDIKYSKNNKKFNLKPENIDRLPNSKNMNIATDYDTSQLKITLNNSVIEEMSLSKDNSIKKVKPPIKDDVTLHDKWSSLVDINEEYL